MSALPHSGKMTGTRKAAILLVLLGEEAAAAVYRNLPELKVHELTHEIAELDTVTPEMSAQILQEYHSLSLTQEYIARGGTDYATKLLVKAFGENAARDLLDQVGRLEDMKAGNLDSLEAADPQQLAKFLEGEHPQTIALILAHLTANRASTLLLLLSEQTRAETVKRLAEMRQFPPEMAQKISLVLHKKLQSLGEQSRRGYSGVKSVAELLNRMDPEIGKKILERVESDNPELAISIRHLMFTFEDLLSANETGVRELLSALDKKTLTMALKGASDELKNHIFKTMSSRASEMMKEDLDALGPVRMREVVQAQRDVIEIARKLEADGKLVLKAESEEFVV
jgi:flagellar motor switch protein FliG